MVENQNLEETQKQWDAILITTIAMACHEATKVWCMRAEDYSMKHWNQAEEWQLESALRNVEFRLNNPNAKPDPNLNIFEQKKIALTYAIVDALK